MSERILGSPREDMVRLEGELGVEGCLVEIGPTVTDPRGEVASLISVGCSARV